ncbi:MAG: Verru_Chthon cassette protein A [Verrucomicrobium sp.]
MKSPQNRNKGAALVIVLSILTILVTLVLAFFSMVQTESKSSANFAESVEVRNLTDVPVNLAISQLRKATENLGPVGADTYFKTWSSQPGMIRVYGVEPDAANVRSKTVALYKLYSDDAMVVAKSGANSSGSGMANSEVAASLRQDTDDLGIWDTKPGMFTDLNEPVPVPGTTPSYKFPILDPRAAVAGPGGYAVDGFKVFKGGDPSAPSGAASVAGTVTATSRTDLAARVPMPVRWLYILKDGTTITPTSADATKATFTTTASASAPTSQNPIVGRVAFWTDDDSNKININTSSEGSGWEIPVSTSQTDKDFASRVPAQNEFSRYPGHPATTSLSTVFQAFGTDFFVDATTDPNTAVFARLHKLSPRTPWGGHQGWHDDPWHSHHWTSRQTGAPLCQCGGDVL